MARVSSPVVVGREVELATFLDALARLGEPGGRVVLVTGEAGIGKSRFLAEARASLATGEPAEPRGAWLAGSCLDLAGTPIPYVPIIEIAEAAGALLGDDARSRIQALVDDLTGASDERPGRGVDAGLAGSRVLRRIRDLGFDVARGGPAVVAIDDLQWADESTLDLVRYLARSWRDRPLALVLAYRSDELHRRHPLRPVLAELERSDVLERIELRRLSPDEVDGLIAAIAGADAVPDARARIHRLADGNPFHVEELLAAPRDLGPGPTLRSVLLARLHGADEDVHRVLRAAAVVGRDVTMDELVAVGGLEPERLAPALARSIELFVLEVAPDGIAVRFRHALMREAVYDELLPSDRIELHRRAAAHLETQPRARLATGSLERAHHLAQAQSPDAPAAFIEAGRAAGTAHAWKEAASAYERAIASMEARHATPAEGWVELLREAALAVFMAGRPDRARSLVGQALASAEDAPEPERDSELLTMAAYLAAETGDRVEMVRMAEAAVALASDVPDLVRVRALDILGGVHMQEGRNRDAIATSSDAIVLADALSERRLEVTSRTIRAIAYGSLGRMDEAYGDLDATERLLRDQDDPDGLGHLHVNRASVLAMAGRSEAVIQATRDGLDVARREGLEDGWVPWLAPMAAEAAFWLGRWDEADAFLDASLAEDLPASSTQRMSLEEARTLIAGARGDAGAGDRAATAAEAAGGRAVPDALAGVRMAAALAYCWEGDHEAALEQVRVALAELDGLDGFHPNELLLMTGIRAAADAVLRSRARGDQVTTPLVDEAETWAADLHALADGSYLPEARPTELGRWADALGRAELARLLDRGSPADWQDAIDRSTTLAIPLFEAYARYRAGEAGLRTGDRDAAAHHLRTAARTADDLGARPLLAAITDLARRARLEIATSGDEAAPPDPPVKRPWGLSAREVEVLALVAEGRTNRQIGEALFITEKTASVHVTHILDKLGVGSRVEAALLAGRAGVLRDVAGDEPPGATP